VGAWLFAFSVYFVGKEEQRTKRNVREIGNMIRDIGFWNDLEVVHSLAKLVKDMAKEIESKKPLVGQCLFLWNELRTKVKDWCSKFNIAEAAMEKLIERRFRKNYHPAVRLIFLHATSCGFGSWSMWKWVCSHGHYKTTFDFLNL